MLNEWYGRKGRGGGRGRLKAEVGRGPQHGGHGTATAIREDRAFILQPLPAPPPAHTGSTPRSSTALTGGEGRVWYIMRRPGIENGPLQSAEAVSGFGRRRKLPQGA